jgi:NADH-quinone oxidoreductase subunit J
VTSTEVVFVLLSAVGSIGAFRLVTSKNVVHAALYLVLTLSMVGAAYLVLAAGFLAWVQVLIYVGAIVVLLLFSLMLTKAPIGRETLDNQQRGWAFLVGAGVLAGLVFLIQNAFGSVPRIQIQPATTSEVGASLFANFVLPFEVVSVLLLAALVGAVVIARRDERP